MVPNITRPFFKVIVDARWFCIQGGWHSFPDPQQSPWAIGVLHFFKLAFFDFGDQLTSCRAILRQTLIRPQQFVHNGQAQGIASGLDLHLRIALLCFNLCFALLLPSGDFHRLMVIDP